MKSVQAINHLLREISSLLERLSSRRNSIENHGKEVQIKSGQEELEEDFVSSGFSFREEVEVK